MKRYWHVVEEAVKITHVALVTVAFVASTPLAEKNTMKMEALHVVNERFSGAAF